MTSEQDFSINNKHVLITGGTAGIGLGIARHFVKAGAQVIISGRRDSGCEIAKEIGAKFVKMDVSDSTSITVSTQKAATLLDGRIDVLILNAGVDLAVGTIDELDMENFKRLYEVNVFGVVQGLRDSLKFMIEGGSVIITSSPAGSQYAPAMSAYSSSKAAINALVKLYALELGLRNIRVNAVLPGIVETEMGSSTGTTEMIRSLTATGIVRKSHEMGGVYQFLASNISGPLTGAIIGADDGLSAGLSLKLMEKASS